MREPRLQDRHQLRLVAREAPRHERRPEPERQRHRVDRLLHVGLAALRLRAGVGGGRELSLGEAVHAVVLDDVERVDVAADGMAHLAEADRERVAVAADADVRQAAIRRRRAGQDRRHSSVRRVEAVRAGEKVGRRLRGAADARELGDHVRRDVELEEGPRDGGGDRVVTAAGAERRHGAFVVADGEAELVRLQRRVPGDGLLDVAHASSGGGTGARPVPRIWCTMLSTTWFACSGNPP